MKPDTPAYREIISTIKDRYEIDLTISKPNLTGGVNSIVHQLRENNLNKYALKIYPARKTKKAVNRQEKEVEFLKHYKSVGGEHAPTVVGHDIERNWTLMSWVDGKKPTDLNDADLEAIGEFMLELNTTTKKTDQNKKKLRLATDAITCCKTLPNDIQNRLYKIKIDLSRMKETRNTISLYNWLNNEVHSYAQTNSAALLDRAEHAYWNDESLCNIISPSDVGIHNIKKNNGKLFFLDFEYSGYDDLSKFYCDWIMQPNYPFSKRQRDSFMKKINARLNKFNDSWISRHEDLKKLNHLKWALIIAKHEIKKGADDLNWSRIDNYWRLIFD